MKGYAIIGTCIDYENHDSEQEIKVAMGRSEVLKQFRKLVRDDVSFAATERLDTDFTVSIDFNDQKCTIEVFDSVNGNAIDIVADPTKDLSLYYDANELVHCSYFRRIDLDLEYFVEIKEVDIQ